MKILKYVGLTILAIALLYLGLCALMPKNFDMKYDTDIDAPVQTVFNIVNDLGTTEQWNDWNLKDTSMVVTYTDKSVGVGAKTSWVSTSSGNGSQEIVESIKNQRIKTALQFEGWDNIDHGIFEMAADGKKTNLSWAFEAGENLPFLMRGAMGLMGMKGQMKKSYKAGLQNIKTLAEQREKELIYNGYKIELVDLPERNYIMTRREITFDKIQDFFASSQGQLFQKIQQAGVVMEGNPCGLFFRYDVTNGVTDMATALPVATAVSVEGTASYSIESKKAIQVSYYGDFKATEPAHYAVEAYMNDHDLLQDSPIIEEYITSTYEDKDPSKWLTKISYYFSERG